MLFDGLGLVLAAYQTLSALQRGKWGKKNTRKVVAEDVLAVNTSLVEELFPGQQG